MKERLPERITLENGLRIVHLPNKGEVAHIGITVLAGSRFENDDEIGLAHFIEHSIFKGTKKRKAYHILSRLDAVGGELNAFTSKEEMCLYASFTRSYLNRGMELLADVIGNSTFPSKELEREKEVIYDEINSYLDTPAEHIFDEFEGLIFKGHALGNNILGTRESVSSFKREHILKFMARYYFPENMVLSVVGPYSLKRVAESARKFFGEMKGKANIEKLSPFKTYCALQEQKIYSNYQSHVIVGGMACDLHSDKRLGTSLLTNIMGGPALNSRLSMAIREKHGLVYSIETHFSPFIDAGYHSIYFGTDKNSVDKALQLMQKELHKIKNQSMGKIQFSMAKEQLKGQLALAGESNANLMLGLGKSVLTYDNIESSQELFQKIDALQASEIMELANELYDEKQLSKLIFVPEEG